MYWSNGIMYHCRGLCITAGNYAVMQCKVVLHQDNNEYMPLNVVSLKDDNSACLANYLQWQSNNVLYWNNGVPQQGNDKPQQLQRNAIIQQVKNEPHQWN